MELLLHRKPTVKNTTFGDLFVDNQHFCYTLEDTVREIEGKAVSEWKVYGETAIPVGKYKLGIVDSPRFGADTLTLLNVPGFDDIRIHGGNDDADTHGCLLVGDKMLAAADDGGNLGDSKVALNRLKGILVLKLKNKEEIFITIKKAGPLA